MRNALSTVLTIAALLAAGCSGSSGASAAPPVISPTPASASPLPSASPSFTPNGAFVAEYTLRNPINAIAQGSDGNMWATETAAIARISPTGAFTEFPLAAGESAIVRGPDGNMWFTENTNRVGRITPSGSILEYALDSPAGAITSGADGNIYLGMGRSIARLNPNAPGGSVTTFPALAYVGAMTAGADGNLWYLTTDGASLAFWVARVTPQGAQAGPWSPFFPCSSASCFFRPFTAIITGPDGNVYMSGRQGAWRVAPDGTLTGLCGSGDALAFGADGNLWSANVFTNSLITRMTPGGQCTTVDYGRSVTAFAPGPNRTLWFLQSDPTKIGIIQL